MKNILYSLMGLLWTMSAFAGQINITINSQDKVFTLQPFFVVYVADNNNKIVQSFKVMEYTPICDHDIQGDPLLYTTQNQLFMGVFEINDVYIDQQYKVIFTQSLSPTEKEIFITLDKNKPIQTATGHHHMESMRISIQ